MFEKTALSKLVIPSDTADLGASRFNLYLIGAGGTGSFTAQHMCRMMTFGGTAGERIASLTIVDFDIVEPKNVGRQLFIPADVGKSKAEVLARRYGSAYGIKIGWIPQPFTRKMLGEIIPPGNLREPTVLIGAVDTAAARLEMFTAVKQYSGYRQAVYWFDAGNGRSRGQVVWGNTTNTELVRKGIGKAVVEYLPYPPCVFPEIIDPSKDGDELRPDSALSCAEAVQSGQQGPNINALMAALMVEMLNQFLTGKLSTHYVAVELNGFMVAPQSITDEWLAACA